MTRGSLFHEVYRPPRWNTFFAGLVINGVALIVVVIVAPNFMTVEQRDPIATSNHVTLVAPVFEPSARLPEPTQLARLESPKPVLPPVPVTPLPPARAEVPRVSPKIETKLETTKIEPPKPELRKFESAMVANPSGTAAKRIRTNVFESEKPEIATVRKPPSQVQTGGFGDPQGVAGNGDPKRNALTVASVGAFDMPSGPGTGNGTGGSRGVTGVVRNSGFGEGVPSGAPARVSRSVVSSGFHEAIAQGSPTPELQRVAKKPDLQPVEILYKPRPAYTVEARQRRVEGEVLLDVLFSANGSLHVNQIVKGLGYGLDDNALVAAQHIQFRPARRDGQPYDCAALVHIVFELAE